jgi:hypothetical protein
MSTSYIDQVQLLVNLLPIVEKQACFALKGGTAEKIHDNQWRSDLDKSGDQAIYYEYGL